jgi:RecA/RadA recombinase
MKTLDELDKYAEKRVGHSIASSGDDMGRFKHVPTGSFLLNLATLGGYPTNCVATLVGDKGAGKTTMVYKAIGNSQLRFPDKKCVYINQEKAYQPVWAAYNGVDTPNLRIYTPTNAEQAIDIAVASLETDEVFGVFFDSIPALVGAKELEKSAEDSLSPGSVAVLANRLMRAISSKLSESYNADDHKLFIMIQQWRVGIGSAPHMPRTMPGGKYTRHYSSTEIDIKNSEEMGMDHNEMKVVSHNDHTFKIHKIRAGNSIREGDFKMIRMNQNGMGPGDIDDFDTVVRYYQKFKQAGGAGKGWWMIHPETGEELRFGSRTEIVQYVFENRDVKALMERRIINLARKSQGMPTEGWW